jgi:hypothetical protein
MHPPAANFAFSNFSVAWYFAVSGRKKAALLLPIKLASLHKLSMPAVEFSNIIISAWWICNLRTNFALPLRGNFLFKGIAAHVAQQPTTLVAKFLSTKPAQLQQFRFDSFI